VTPPAAAPVPAPAPKAPTIAPVSAPTPASVPPAGGVSPSPSSSSPAPAVVVPAASKKSSIVAPVAGAVAGAAVLGALGFCFLCFYRRRHSKKRKGNVLTENQPLQAGVLPSTGTTADPEFVKIVVESGSTNGSHHRGGQVIETLIPHTLF
jgi:hypothetical protein